MNMQNESFLNLWEDVISSKNETSIFIFKKAIVHQKNQYECIWEKTETTDNAATAISLHFQFDYPSFLKFWQQMYPEDTISENDVATTIGIEYARIGKNVLIFGNRHYDELAKMVNLTKGQRKGQEFGF